MSNTAIALAQTKTERAVEVLREYVSMPISKKVRIMQLLEDGTKATCFLGMSNSELRDRWVDFNSGRKLLSRSREVYYYRAGINFMVTTSFFLYRLRLSKYML